MDKSLAWSGSPSQESSVNNQGMPDAVALGNQAVEESLKLLG